MSAALRLQLRPSYRLAAAILAAHGAAAAAVIFLKPDLTGAALGAALLALGGAAGRSRALLRGPHAVRALEILGEELACELASGRSIRVRAASRRYVSRWLVSVRLGGALARTLLVSADMLEPCEFRRLRLWALWGKLPDVASGQLAG